MAAVSIVLLLILLPVLTLIGRTLYFRNSEAKEQSSHNIEFSLSEESIKKLVKAIQLKTVSFSDRTLIDMNEHRKFNSYLEENFPLAHKHMEKTALNDFAYIFKWKGKNSNTKPVLFMAHFDVVPVQTEGWKHSPFSGDIEDGILWGRGTLDTKNSLVAVMESAEILLTEGFEPERTIYFAFGGDEEISGIEGAIKTVEFLKKKGTHFEWVLDEGSIIAKNMVSMTEKPLALIGVAEKGFANILLSASGTGGHASMPPKHTASGYIARAVTRMEGKPFPTTLSGTVSHFLRSLIPHTGFPAAVVLSNLWLFKGLIKLIFKKSPATAAMIRTTQAATVMKGSEKDNILPDRAEAIVNIRIIPGENTKKVLKRVKKIVCNKEVDVRYMDEAFISDPVPESDINGHGYRLIKEAVGAVYPDAVAAPFLVTVSTDSRHYREITDNIYRFSPMMLTPEDLKTIHGVNESISLENFGKMIQFFKVMMRNL
ncbi:MAG: M20 family peptidase [Spirochaetales bacterium]|nr:M20 family peptidase [Spirochaetales bacterium]